MPNPSDDHAHPASLPRSPSSAAVPPHPPPPPEFHAIARELGVEFEPGDVDRLGQFLARMLEVNATHNLTAITDPAQAWVKHIADALTLVPAIASATPSGSDQASNQPADQAATNTDSAASLSSRSSTPGASLSLIDVGSGGGVPALPLAIILPDVSFTLVEATGKKAAFLKQAALELNLSNVRVVQERAERLGQDHKAHREKYDIATARAVGHLSVIAELLGPLVKPGGLVIAVKGQKADQELAEAKEAMGLIGLRHADTVQTPTGRLVLLEKTTRTPRTYPRRDGEPARVPLGKKT